MTALAVARFGGKELQFAIRIKGRSGALGEFGFMIPGVHLAHSARTENLNDRLGFGRMVGRSIVWLGFLSKQSTHCHGPEPATQRLEKIPPTINQCRRIHSHSRVHDRG